MGNSGRGFGEWEIYSRGIGRKILQQLGFEAGKGLGKNLQGRTETIDVHATHYKDRRTLGFYRHQEEICFAQMMTLFQKLLEHEAKKDTKKKKAKKVKPVK